ncbi:MAG: 30S ribosomal protein S21 [Dehalococcoidia bacterium]
MAEVRLGRDESFESLLKRFNKKVQANGILSEARRREYFEKPCIRRKKKEAARRRKAARAVRH